MHVNLIGGFFYGLCVWKNIYWWMYRYWTGYVKEKINSLSEEERAKYDELNKKYIIENLHIGTEKQKVKRK